MSLRRPRSLSRRGFLSGGFLRFLGAEGVQVSGTCSQAANTSFVARILPTACVAFRGTLCVTCEERCPVPGAVVLERGRPRIDSELCDGCGVCVEVCPAPQKAIQRTPVSPLHRSPEEIG